MTLLATFQNACKAAGLPEPSSVVGSTDLTTKQLLAISYIVGNELREAQRWPQLNREASITLVAAQANYALPADFDYQVFETHWNSNDNWPVYGPLSESEWQALKHNGLSSSVDQHFRIKGCGNNQLYFDPTPGTGDAGKIVKFEYQSGSIFRPRTWTTGMVATAGSYCFYNGYFFSTVAGDTTGATAPTPSALNDGGVTWVQFTSSYETFLADTDECMIDSKLFELGVIWNFLAAKNLPYDVFREKYERKLRLASSKLRGAETLYLTKRGRLFGFNVPDSGYGE